MGIWDLFSNRNKPLPEVYQYDEMPDALRIQVVHILQETIGETWEYWQGWRIIAKIIAKEHGLLQLPQASSFQVEPAPPSDCLAYILREDLALVLDAIEVYFSILARDRSVHQTRVAHGIDEMNDRFRRHALGFALVEGQFVRVDSQILHNEVVVPTLCLLSVKGFEGANAEFLAAHEHFRHGRVEAAMTEACKAFESTMKVICTSLGHAAEARATAWPLIQKMIELGVVKGYSEEQLQNVAKCLLGVATARNKDSGHGSGAEPRDLRPHYAAYALHLAASNIVFLVEGYRALKAGL